MVQNTIKLTRKQKKELSKQLEKVIKEDNTIIKELKKNNGKLIKLGLKIKAATFVSPSKDILKTKEVGGLIELIETKSKYKALDGWNLDLGSTQNFKVYAGISKDFKLASTDWSLGVYVDVIDVGQRWYNKIFNKKESEEKIKVKIGLSEVIF